MRTRTGFALGGLAFAGLVTGVAISGASHHPMPTTPPGQCGSLSYCTPPAPSAMMTWFRANQTYLQLASNDATAASQTTNPTTLAADCAKLNADIVTLQAQPGIPDDAINGTYQEALQSYAQGSMDCVEAIDGFSVPEADAAANLISLGNSDMAVVDSNLNQLQGSAS